MQSFRRYNSIKSTGTINRHLKLQFKHRYHLVNPSPWPLIISLAAVLLLIGFAAYLNRLVYSGVFLMCAFTTGNILLFFWFRDILRESLVEGQHTTVVRFSIMFGFLLFLISETMVFFGIFWAYFHSMLNPAIWLGCIWPPEGITPINFYYWPLTNTLLLLSSGVAITWAHYSLVAGNLDDARDGLYVVLGFAIAFIGIQVWEYKGASFSINDSIYGSLFFSITGLHGLHVILGTFFIYINGVRAASRHFSEKRHNGFVFSAWYWHFVDIVWLFVYLVIYIGGA